MASHYNSSQMEEYIQTLWITQWLSLEEIQKIYKKKAMEYHPDRNHGFRDEAEKKMKQLNIAFDYIKKYYDFYISLNETENDFFDDENYKDSEEETFEEIWEFYLWYARAKKNGKWGFIDKNYNEVVPFIYDNVWNFSENLAWVKKNGKAWFINSFWKEKISLSYDWVEEFKNWYAKICKNWIEWRVDTNGTEYFETKSNYSNEYENEKSFDEMNKYEKIEYLANLNKKWILSNEEFEIEKNKLLWKDGKKSENTVKTEKKLKETNNEQVITKDTPMSFLEFIGRCFLWMFILGWFINLFEWIWKQF